MSPHENSESTSGYWVWHMATWFCSERYRSPGSARNDMPNHSNKPDPTNTERMLCVVTAPSSAPSQGVPCSATDHAVIVEDEQS